MKIRELCFRRKINSSGYVALSTVIVILAVVIALVIGVTYSSIGEGQSGLALLKGEDNLNFVEGCVEDMMLKARSDPNYNGGTIGRPGAEGTCVITVNSKTGTNPVVWDVTITSQTTDYKRTINVIFDRAPTGISLTSWNET